MLCLHICYAEDTEKIPLASLTMSVFSLINQICKGACWWYGGFVPVHHHKICGSVPDGFASGLDTHFNRHNCGKPVRALPWCPWSSCCVPKGFPGVLEPFAGPWSPPLGLVYLSMLRSSLANRKKLGETLLRVLIIFIIFEINAYSLMLSGLSTVDCY